MTLKSVITGIVVLFTATVASFAVVPTEEGPLRKKVFRHPELDYGNVFRPVTGLPVDVSRRLGSDLSHLGVDPGNAYFDRRTGRWGTLIVTWPLIPGSGVGNTLKWSDISFSAQPGPGMRKRAAWKAFRDYLAQHAAELRIDTGQLGEPRVTSFGDRLIQIHVGRRVDGISVRNTFVKATVNSGNLVLLGQRNWGNVELQRKPEISSTRAEQVLGHHLGEVSVSGFRKAPRLEIAPVSAQPDDSLAPLGAGLQHRLVWVLTPEFEGDLGTWEALVDAHSGELLSFEDTNRYASRRVGGGIFPVSNDGTPPDGVEQPGYPMPFADVTVDGEPLGFTSTGGNAPADADGTISTALSGRYVRMNDNCGAIDESAESGNLDLGDGPGTDCDVPIGHSAGDTHASRTGFYELNRLIEQARGYLPNNFWLGQQITANMNINANCNAFFNGSTVNFYTSGGGCGNTGEIAAIFDHEWGHALDFNDSDLMISSPGEAIADIIAQNRLNESCIGRGFRLSDTCGGFGDPCTECTGVRESDWEKRQSGQPHGIDWILGSCPAVGQVGPCARETHCEGTIVAEAAWDLVHRDFQGFEGSPINLDSNTALELGSRLSYYGSSNVGDWYQCATDGTGGCNADGGYLGYLAADDDNGSLEDGTPHMSAIFSAFDRHQLACPSPAVQDAGCAGGPTEAPQNVSAAPFHEGAQLTWDPVPGASGYWIFRTEGVHGCDFGKAKIGETTGTAFAETGLRNDFEVLYSVVAVGENGTCTGAMSACQAVTPLAGPGFSFVPASFGFEETIGDGDGFFDNCETATLTFELANVGEGELTNVRIVEASTPSHLDASVLTELPSTIAASLATGESAAGELTVVGGGFEFDETLELQVGVTSDELAPITLFQSYTLAALESDLSVQESITFSFEEGADGWQVVGGSFDRSDAGGGADGTSFYRASSSGLNQHCDQIRSPHIRLTETSTLELYNQYDIEEFNESWWDRANVGVFDPITGERTVVSPDDGRTYNASGTNAAPAPCASDDPPGQPGWAGAGSDWQSSSWSAAALGSPELAGQLIQLDVAYGTDPAVTGAFGFWFDEVTMTDVFVQVPNAQNSCTDFAPIALAVDTTGNGILEPGESVVTVPSWRNVGAFTGSLAGTGESFSGPASGSLYAIVDGNAAYGVVDSDEAVSCAVTGDCYHLSVFDVSTRPAQHWDATFREVTTSTDTEKAWTLHLGDSFADVPRENLFYTPVETLLHAGITGGCSDSEYCPAGSNTRAQMATFLLRALEGGDYTPPDCVTGDERFDDVPADNLFCPWVEELAERGVTAGCDGDNYCPDASVTRAQMAIFLLKALEGEDYAPPGCTEVFTDVPCPSLFADWIEDLAARGITSGCSDSEYCPATPVTRAQMASFVTTTFALTLYGP